MPAKDNFFTRFRNSAVQKVNHFLYGDRDSGYGYSSGAVYDVGDPPYEPEEQRTPRRRRGQYREERYAQDEQRMNEQQQQMYQQQAYQQQNSIIAIGSGQLYGKGLNNNMVSSVKGGNFIAEPQTDFIFAVAGEELGFLGCCLIILLEFLIALECVRIGRRAKDLAGSLICCGMASLIMLQSFVNISVATGLMPNTGITLPFVSYGVTSLITLCMGIGIVINVGLQSRKY